MNWSHYEKLLLNREEETLILLTEAEKHYRQAQANYEAAKRERAAWMEGTNGIYTAQKDDGTRDTISK